MSLITLDRTNWHQGSGQILFAWTIFNPNGPTFYCFGYRNTSRQREYFYRWLHMLGGNTWTLNQEQVSDSLIDDCLNAFITLHNRFAAEGGDTGPFHTIPSFVLTIDNSAIENLVGQLMSMSPLVCKLDWGRELALLRAYGTDLFGRAGAETRFALDRELEEAHDEESLTTVRAFEAMHSHIESFRNPVELEYDPSPFTNTLFDEWWHIVRDPDFLHQAIHQFSVAWVGAISQCSADFLAPYQHDGRFTTFDQLCRFLENFGFPIWEPECTSRIESLLGLTGQGHRRPETERDYS